ncbi:polycystic kidney disease protein 1-like 2 [Stylophora pistillata]|nr:polycystic kidney disease protein 1-like 2 [Stylophora pistillata]
MSAYDIYTALPPAGGNCSITPPSGISLESDSILSCSNWKSDNTPLSYQFQYSLGNDLYSVLYDGLNSTIVTSWIPPGNSADNYTVKINVTVTDKFGISASPVHLTIQIKPTQRVQPASVNLMANNSLFNVFIKKRNLEKAALIANSVLRSMSRKPSMDSRVINYIIGKMESLEVKNVVEILQSSSVIGSALELLETVSPESLNLSLSAVGSMTSLLWSIAQSKDVADIPLITKSAQNLASCLDSVLKAAALIASKDFKSSFQEQGKILVKISIKVLEKVADSVLALTVPDDNTISITAGQLSMTLGRYSIDRLSRRVIRGGRGQFILPTESRLLVSRVHKTSFADVQMLSLPFNPYTWDGTNERVGSDVLSLHLKNDKGELMKISDISEDITIVTPLKFQEIPTEWSKYFTKKGDLSFHEIKVKYENTLLMLEIKPRDTTVHMFVYMRFGQRPTTQDFDLNATISHGEKCVWMPSAHEKKEDQTFCSLNSQAPIQILAEQPGKYFLGLKNYNATVNLPHKREKRSCFEGRRRKRSCNEVKDAPATPPRSQIVSVVPAYDSTSDQNYSLKVSSGSCVHWSEELEKWISSGCRVLAASDGFLNCSCNHLTSFGGSLIVEPNPIDFEEVIVQFQNLSETGNVAVIVAIAVVFLCYMVVLVIVWKIDRKDAKNGGLLIHLPSSSNGTFEYEIVITTGIWKNAGTTARVAMEIYGSGGKSGIFQLSQEEPGVVNMLFSRSNSDVFVLSLNKSLGSIQAVHIGHNNFGNNPSWFLEEILIRDVQSNQSWKFMVSQWFALERGDGRIERVIDLTSTRLGFVSDVARRWRRGLTEWHIWVSVAAKLKQSRFTRVQRLSCCLSVLLTSMFANAMFYKLGGKYEQPIQVGPLKMSGRQVVTGIESALAVAPVNIIIVLLFQKGAEKSYTNNGYCLKGIVITGIAWVLLLCSCIASSAFSIFYSLIWEKTVSEQWLSSMLISFAQDLIIKEPVKVFFTALLLAAILKIKNKRSTEHARKNSQQVKSRCSKQRFWTLKLSEVEKMRKCQAKKQNLSRYFTELAIYLVFVFLLMIVCFGNRNDHRYLMKKSIWDGLANFKKVANNTMYWSWLQNVFLPGVFSGRLYNGQEEKQTIYIGDKHSLLVGMARVRQFRVKSTQCKVLKFMDTLFRECFEGYSTKNEDKTAYNKPGWRPLDNATRNDELLLLCPKPWRYQHAEETDIVPKWGQFSFYHGGGFVADLGYENHTGFNIVTSLQNNGWLDRHTAVVLAEFSTFNPSVNILGVATYFYEIESSGLKAASTQISVLFLHSTDTTWHKFYLICLFLFIVLVFLYSGRGIFRIYNYRSRYFKSKWNWVEIFQLVFSLLAVVMHIMRQIKVTSTMRKLRENIYANIHFQEAITWQQAENGVLGILMFIVTTKLLRVIRFNKHVVVYSKTLKISWRSLSSFSIVLLTLFIAFLHFGVLMFGSVSERYSSVLKGAYFQLEITLGRVKARTINELAEANTIYAKIFAFLILFTLSILCMNLFIAMINDALLEAKRNVNESELHELTDDDICSSSKERGGFFDAISKTLKQWTVSQTCEKEENSELENVGIHFKKSSTFNFDEISQSTELLREEIAREKTEEHRCSIRRQSFFDNISSMLKSAKCENNNECGKGKEKKKVRFQEDVIESSFRKLRKRKQDLLQRLNRIVSGFSEEDREFDDLLKAAEAQNYWIER